MPSDYQDLELRYEVFVEGRRVKLTASKEDALACKKSYEGQGKTAIVVRCFEALACRGLESHQRRVARKIGSGAVKPKKPRSKARRGLSSGTRAAPTNVVRFHCHIAVLGMAISAAELARRLNSVFRLGGATELNVRGITVGHGQYVFKGTEQAALRKATALQKVGLSCAVVRCAVGRPCLNKPELVPLAIDPSGSVKVLKSQPSTITHWHVIARAGMRISYGEVQRIVGPILGFRKPLAIKCAQRINQGRKPAVFTGTEAQARKKANVLNRNGLQCHVIACAVPQCQRQIAL